MLTQVPISSYAISSEEALPDYSDDGYTKCGILEDGTLECWYFLTIVDRTNLDYYLRDDVYWIEPNTPVKIVGGQTDLNGDGEGSFFVYHKYQYFRALDYTTNTELTRNRHDFTSSSVSQNTAEKTNPNIVVNSARRLNNTTLGEVEWTVTPKTHGMIYKFDRKAVLRNGWSESSYRSSTPPPLIGADSEAPTLTISSPSGYALKEGNKYWIRKDEELTGTVRVTDPHSGVKRLRLYTFPPSNLSENYVDYNNITSAPYKTSSTGMSTLPTPDLVLGSRSGTSANFNYSIKGKYSGDYLIEFTTFDNLNHQRFSSPFTIGVDGTAPSFKGLDISGERYKSGSNYWVKPNDSLTVNLKLSDTGIGMKSQTLSLYGGDTHNAVSTHNILSTDKTNKSNNKTTTGIEIISAERISEDEVKWVVKPKINGESYQVRYSAEDKIDNVRELTNSFRNIKVDGVGPKVAFRNTSDTEDFNSRLSTSSSVTVKIKNEDDGSGYKRSRYAWTTTSTKPSDTSSEWSDWSTGSNYNTTTLYNDGTYYLHVQSEDNVGNITNTKAGAYIIKTTVPPVADFSIHSSPTNRITDVTFKDASTDKDNDIVTYDYDYRKKGSTTWLNLSSTKDFTYRFKDLGTYEVRLTVKDATNETSQKVKEVQVSNLRPVPDFSLSTSIGNRITPISFKNLSTDPENDQLSYTWQYRQKGSFFWNDIGTSKDLLYSFNQVGVFEVRLKAGDEYGLSDYKVKEVTIDNLDPIAKFSSSPNPTNRLTSVNFVSQSTDPEGDSISSYKYEYRKKGSTTWTTMSTKSSTNFKFNELGTYEVRLTVTDEYGASNTSSISEIKVNNQSPVAKFSASPNPSNRLTNINFTSQSTDPEGDSIISYKYEYRKQGETSWNSLSTSSSPSYKFNSVGKYEVRLTVTDEFGASNTSSVQIVDIQNLNPVSKFTATPNPSDRLTTVNFKSQSTDPENDKLTYKYEYRKKSSTTWSNLGTSANSTFKFNQVGVFEVRLTVTDEYGGINNSVMEVAVNNLNPIADFDSVKTVNMEGDSLSFKNKSSDPEGDTLSHKWTVKFPDGTIKTYSATDISIPYAEAGIYNVTLEVTDSYGGKRSVTKSFNVIALKLDGLVEHTTYWKSIHDYYGNNASDFYSGEKFVLRSDITDYPIDSLTVTMSGYNMSNQMVKETVSLSNYVTVGDYRRYNGELFKTWMSDPKTRLKNGQVLFKFDVEFSNGVVKTDVVTINIIGTAYIPYDLHRTN